MLPTLSPGMVALGVRTRRIHAGQVVIARDPLGHVLAVKRVNSVRRQRRQVWLVGDNPRQSADSRTWGWVDQGDVLAHVILAWRSRSDDRESS
jgi:hypothetical protein